MDELLFQKQLDFSRTKTEDVSWLEIFNYSDPSISTAEHRSELRTTEAFMSFLKSEPPFASRELAEGVKIQDGIRLILQTTAENPEAFDRGVISLELPSYKALIKEFQLSFRCIDASSAVGPCFWLAHVGNNLQVIFRKSDVAWKGTSRGWEMMLSYSFDTGMTSGYVRAKKELNFNKVLDDLVLCGRPVSHPLLLPILTLCKELSPEFDTRQKEMRAELRKLDEDWISRDRMAPATHYTTPGDPEIDKISNTIALCQTEVLQKSSQAWQNVVDNVEKAMVYFWNHVPAERKSPDLTEIHNTLLDRLKFLAVKLQGTETYAYVTFERLSILREVVHNVTTQRQSRLHLEIAIQQQRLADSSGRESASTNRLSTILSYFLPGTFIATIFSMPFFDFSTDMKGGHVSPSLWIYFALSSSLTLAVVMLWSMVERTARRKYENGAEIGQVEARIDSQREAEILRRLRMRTGVGG